jgi:sugar O-acyltransferase (sialic acid O-acetyltransferase NeuD family)
MSDTPRLRVAIAGAGGMGREALAWLRDARPDVDPVAFFTRDASERPKGAGVDLPVVDTVARLADAGVDAVVLAVGDVDRRADLSVQLRDASLPVITVVHPSAFLGPGIQVGEGSIVAPGCIITRDVTIAPMTIINYGARIGHDCSVGRLSFVGPGAVLTGAVTLAERAFIGAGAVILPEVTVGPGAIVGAGAIVTADVPRGTTVVGNPAIPMSREGVEDVR